MNKDYQFLIGHYFSVGGEIYVVSDLQKADQQTFVKAELVVEAAADGTYGDIVVGEAHAQSADRIFTLRDVIQGLLVDEEIELFNPNYLAAR